MNGIVHTLGILGSLREPSYDRAALRASQELAAAGATLEVMTLPETGR